MPIMFPRQLEWVSYVVTGQPPPRIDEDRVFGLGEHYRTVSDGVGESGPLLKDAVDRTRRGANGRAGDAFLAAMESYANRRPAAVQTVQSLLAQMADRTRNSGTAIQHAKISILAALIELFLEILLAFAFAAYSPTALAWLGARFIAFRRFMNLLLTRLSFYVASSVGIGAATEVLFEWAVQRIQIGLGTRDHIDRAALGLAAGVGGAAGAIALGLGGAAGPVMQRMLRDRLAAGGGAARAANVGQDAAIGGVVEGLAEGIASVMTGNPFTFGLSAVGSGVVTEGLTGVASEAGDVWGARGRNDPPPGDDGSGRGGSGSGSGVTPFTPSPIPPSPPGLPPLPLVGPENPSSSDGTGTGNAATGGGPTPTGTVPNGGGSSTGGSTNGGPSNLGTSPNGGPSNLGTPPNGGPTGTVTSPSSGRPTADPTGGWSTGAPPRDHLMDIGAFIDTATGSPTNLAAWGGGGPTGVQPAVGSELPPSSVPPLGAWAQAVPPPSMPLPEASGQPSTLVSPSQFGAVGSAPATGTPTPTVSGTPSMTPTPTAATSPTPTSPTSPTTPTSNSPAAASGLASRATPVAGPTPTLSSSTTTPTSTSPSTSAPSTSTTPLTATTPPAAASGLASRDGSVAATPQAAPTRAQSTDTHVDPSREPVRGPAQAPVDGEVRSSSLNEPDRLATPFGVVSDDGIDAVNQAVTTIGQPGRRIDRLTGWIRRVERDADSEGGVPIDCVPRAWGAFIAAHGRTGNAPVNDNLLRTPTARDLAETLGGQLSRIADPDQLIAGLQALPDAMVLVHSRPPGELGHVFWFDVVGGADDPRNPTYLRAIDTQLRGTSEQPASVDRRTPDWWGRALWAPDTEVLVLGPDGRPIAIDGLQTEPAPSRTAEALLDPSYEISRPSGVDGARSRTQVRLPDGLRVRQSLVDDTFNSALRASIAAQHPSIRVDVPRGPITTAAERADLATTLGITIELVGDPATAGRAPRTGSTLPTVWIAYDVARDVYSAVVPGQPGTVPVPAWSELGLPSPARAWQIRQGIADPPAETGAELERVRSALGDPASAPAENLVTIAGLRAVTPEIQRLERDARAQLEQQLQTIDATHIPEEQRSGVFDGMLAWSIAQRLQAQGNDLRIREADARRQARADIAAHGRDTFIAQQLATVGDWSTVNRDIMLIRRAHQVASLDVEPMDPSASSPVTRGSAWWYADMLPILQQRADRAVADLPPDAPERVTIMAALDSFENALGRAGARSPAQLPRGWPEHLNGWLRAAEDRAFEARSRAAQTRAPADIREALLFHEFPIQATSNRDPAAALHNDDYLPLVHQVLGPDISTVTDDHVATIDRYIDEVWTEQRTAPTLDTLIRHAQLERREARAGRPDDGGAHDQDQRDRPQQQRPRRPTEREVNLLINELRALTDPRTREPLLPTGPDQDQNVRDVLTQLLERMHRRYRRAHAGRVPPGHFGATALRELVDQKLGPGDFTWARIDRVATNYRAKREYLAANPTERLLRVLFRTPAAHRLVGRTRIYQGQAQNLHKRIQRATLHRGEHEPVEMPDSAAQVRAEVDTVWARLATSQHGTTAYIDAAGHQRLEITRRDIEHLVQTRRERYADYRDRSFSGVDDYAAMRLNLLGRSGGPVSRLDLAEMARLVTHARGHSDGQGGAPQLRHRRTGGAPSEQRLTESILAGWNQDRLAGRPAADNDQHSRLVSAFHAIDDSPESMGFVPDLTRWVNGIIPLGGSVVSESTVQRKLVSLFAQALDDGADLAVYANGRWYDIRLWAVATRPPTVREGSRIPAGEQGSDRFAGKGENRIYAYDDRGVTQTDMGGWSLDVGPIVRATPGPTRIDFSPTAGIARAQGRRRQMAVASSTYQFQRIKEKLGRADLSVRWVARVQDRDTRRWRDFQWLGDDGENRVDTVTYSVAEFMLPFTREETYQLPSSLQRRVDPEYLMTTDVDRQSFPVWDLDHAVPRVQLADAVLAEVRAVLSPEDYAFWKPTLEAAITNDTLAMRLGDILRPPGDDTYQRGFRHLFSADGRFLSLSVSPADRDRPIDRVTKISEVSRSLETRFDRVMALVVKSMLSRDRTTTGRLTAALVTRFPYSGVQGRYPYSRRSGQQNIRINRSWVTRAKRLGGRLQVVLADFRVRVDVHHRSGQATAEGSRTVSGFAHLMVAASDLRNHGLSIQPAATTQDRDADRAESAKLAQDAQPNPSRRWYTPGSGYGLTMDYIDRLTGIDAVYNDVVSFMVDQGYLPPAARGEPPTTPWEHLQAFQRSADPSGRTGSVLNQAGAQFENWRKLVGWLSEEWLRIRGDDVFGTGEDQPGIAMSFARPPGATARTGAARAARGDLTIGLSARILDDQQRHDGIHPYTIQYGHMNLDTANVKRGAARVHDPSGQLAAGLNFTEDGHIAKVGEDVAGAMRPGIAGLQATRTANRRYGRSQSSAVASDTDGQNMPTSRYDIPIEWTWRAYDQGDPGAAPLRERTSTADVRLLQPDELATTTDEPVMPALAMQHLPASPLSSMGADIFTVVGANNIDALRRELIETGGIAQTHVWEDLPLSVYKTVLIRSMAGGATMNIGDQTIQVTTVPLGTPQVTRVWKPYTQQVLEAQAGLEQGLDRSRVRTVNVPVSGRYSEYAFVDASYGRGRGTGTGATELYTVGSYRGIYQDDWMALVRTVVEDRVRLEDGTTITARNEVLLNVHLNDVLQNLSSFDDPGGWVTAHATRPVTTIEQNLAEAPIEDRDRLAVEWAEAMAGRDAILGTTPARPALTRDTDTELQPPASLRDGHSWAVVWPLLYAGESGDPGLGGLVSALRAAAEAVGGPELANQVESVPTWTSTYMARLTDGGAAWTLVANNNRYRVELTARLVGPGRSSRPGPTGEKTYERANEYQDQARRNIRTAVTNVSVGGQGPLAESMPINVSLAAARTTTEEAGRTRASNLLAMQGLRANKLTDFTQAVEYTFTVRQLGTAAAVADALGLGRPRMVTNSVLVDHTVSVPTEGTTPKTTPPQDLRFTLQPTLNFNHRIMGLTALRAIFDAVRGTGRGTVRDPSTHQPPPATLNNENLSGHLEQMLTPEGLRVTAVATASELLDLGSGSATIRARYGSIEQLYFMEKAEFERYDHGTDLASSSAVQARRNAGTVTVTVVAPTPAPDVFAGARIAVGKDSTAASARDHTQWIEHRAWLRADSSVYFVYLPLYLTIEVAGADTLLSSSELRTVHTAGAVELVTDRDGARAAGVSDAVLRTVVPERLQAKELGAPSATAARATGQSLDAPAPSDATEAVVDSFAELLDALDGGSRRVEADIYVTIDPGTDAGSDRGSDDGRSQSFGDVETHARSEGLQAEGWEARSGRSDGSQGLGSRRGGGRHARTDSGGRSRSRSTASSDPARDQDSRRDRPAASAGSRSASRSRYDGSPIHLEDGSDGSDLHIEIQGDRDRYTPLAWSSSGGRSPYDDSQTYAVRRSDDSDSDSDRSVDIDGRRSADGSSPGGRRSRHDDDATLYEDGSDAARPVEIAWATGLDPDYYTSDSESESESDSHGATNTGASLARAVVDDIRRLRNLGAEIFAGGYSDAAERRFTREVMGPLRSLQDNLDPQSTYFDVVQQASADMGRVLERLTEVRPDPGQRVTIPVPGDGDCLITSLAVSAAHQGVNLPLHGIFAGSDPRTMDPERRRARIRSLREAWASRLTPQHIVPGDLPDTQEQMFRDWVRDAIERRQAYWGGQGLSDALPDDETLTSVFLLQDGGWLRTRISPADADVAELFWQDDGLFRALQRGIAETAMWNTAVGDSVPYVLATLLQVRLVIHQDNRVAAVIGDPSWPAVHVERVGNNHYNALGPDTSGGGHP